MSDKNVVVIGAGLAGLSAAALLAHKGFHVDVVEKNDTPGGVARKFEINGFTFDMGPTWYLMPEVFRSYFSIFGKKPEDFFDLTKIDPSYKVFFEEGGQALVRPDMEHNRQVFETLEEKGAAKLDAYLDAAHYKYTTAMSEFLYRDYTSLFDFFNKKMLLEGTRLHVFQKLDRYVKRFFKNPNARKILEYNIVFLGCSPYRSPALYSLMSHVDLTAGVYYPAGGIYSLVDALYTLGKERGVSFHFGEEVESIQVVKKESTGVHLKNKFMPADIVLSAIDYHHTETELLSPLYRSYGRRYWKSRVMAPSAFIIMLGIDKKLQSLEHHNLFLSEDWKMHFDQIFDDPQWPANPSFYVGCPSKSDDSIAPNGCENLFILVPVAPDLDDPGDLREKFANAILEKLEKYTGESLREHILVKEIIAHRDFRDANNLFRGSALGLAHTLMQTAVFRPARKSKKVKNLYYTGHYTHPGIGMPMVFISSEVTVNRIVKEMNG